MAKVKVYNKLIRDRIPEICQKKGKEPKIRILSDKEYKRFLKRKLFEEAKELLRVKKNKDLKNEIIDIQEVWLALIHAYGLDRKKLDSLRKKKKKERGGFEKRLLLVSTQTKK